jgi:hypothetical protein
MDIVDKARQWCKTVRTKPTPLSEAIPMVAKLCDENDTLRNQLAECQWISVEDRLPELGQWYLIFVKDKFATMAFLDAHTETGETLWLAHNNNFQGEWENVTHWQPLPQPPKAISEKG